MHMLGIIPLVLLACIALFTRHRYSLAIESRRAGPGKLSAYIACVSSLLSGLICPTHPVVLMFLLLVFALAILNNHFYVFLAGRRGGLFAMAVIPFHWLYFLYSGIGFLIALVKTKLAFGTRERRHLISRPSTERADTRL